MSSDLSPLVADDGELRLARRVASYVYGRREVTWPEDVDDPEDDLPDEREFGWVAKLPGPEPGLSERRFVRGDVQIDAVEQVSEVEQVLDDAASRAGGDVFFESMIEGRGLGRLVPGRDFDEGDLVDVRFWGRVLPDQLVTAVEWHDGVPSVKLGGQALSDVDDLGRARAETLRLIRRERSEREGDVAKVSAAASAAQSTADTARGEVQAVRDSLAGQDAGEPDLLAQLVAVNDELQRLGQDAQPSLMLAFVALSTALWQAQQNIDAVQSAAIAENEARISEIAALTDELVKTQQELVARRIPVLSDGNDGQHFSRNGTTVTAKGTWAGDVQVLEDGVGPRAVRIPNPEGGRTISLTHAGSWVTLLALISQGVMRRFIGRLSRSSPTAPQQWGTVPGSPVFTAGSTIAHTVRATIEWERAVYLADYGLRVLVGGRVVKTIQQSNIGPLIGNGVRSQTVTVTDVQVKSGERIELQAFGTGVETSRLVRSLMLDVVWVEGA